MTGGWFLYAIQSPDEHFPDYPKFGIWSDAIYMTTVQTGGEGGGIYALDRVSMLAGGPASTLYFNTNEAPYNKERLLPADLDGPTPPPTGAPGILMRPVDGPDTVEIWEFHADFANPASSTFGLAQTLAPTAFDISAGGAPQPTDDELLEVISNRFMHRLAYRNLGGVELMVAQHVVDVDNTNHGGIRWYELARFGGSWLIAQEGDYAPDTDHRWNPSIAMDRDGNIAVGYSVSSASTFPSIRYAGRLVSDPAGTLPQGEAVLVGGSASQDACSSPQPSNCRSRWGDYSSLNVDPVDDCTFWYTNEYLDPGRRTRIGAFRFCNDAPTADAGGPYATSEGTAVTLDASGSSDPNPTDDLTYEWDLDGDAQFDDATGETVSFVFGDDGSFPVAVRVTDSRGESDTDASTVVVANVSPDAEIDLSGATLVNGVPTILGHAGDPIDFQGDVTDPGSDDLVLTWDFDDGTPLVVVTSLVNPPSPDPDPSPSVQPRAVTDLQTHAFGDACTYEPSLTAEDDDGGSDVSQANVLIAGNADETRPAGWWQSHTNGKGSEFPEAELLCYLEITRFASAVFDEAVPLSTRADAHDVLHPPGPAPQHIRMFDRELLAAWLNFANGAVEFAELLVDTDGDGTPDTTFGDAVATAEAVRLNPASTPAEVEEQRALIHQINH